MNVSFNLFAALYVSLIWILIWLSSYSQDKALSKAEASEGIVHTNIPTDKRLILFSGLLIVFLTLFYSFIYVEIGVSQYIHSYFFAIHYPLIYLKYLYLLRTVSLIFIFVGMLLMIKSRTDLKAMTSKEVAFSLNTKQEMQVRTGLYAYIKHPMYLGIILITLFSLILFPTLLGSVLFVGIIFCILMKMRIESASTV